MEKSSLDIEKQLSKLGKEIQQFVERVVPAAVENGHFDPPCDIVEGKEEFTVFVDLPGMTKKDIRLALKNRVLTISGERNLYQKEKGDEDVNLKRSERLQGSFSRSFAIPDGTDENSVDARFKDGVLRISLKKLESGEDENAQTIPIK